MFGNATVIEDEDAVGMGYRTQPMSDCNGGSSVRSRLEGLLYQSFRLRVQSGGGLVKETALGQHPSIALWKMGVHRPI